jgi:hypothetical protein
MIEALQTLRRQIDVVAAEVRITERRLEKAADGSEVRRAALIRRDILKGQLGELRDGLRKLES